MLFKTFADHAHAWKSIASKQPEIRTKKMMRTLCLSEKSKKKNRTTIFFVYTLQMNNSLTSIEKKKHTKWITHREKEYAQPIN